MRQMYNPAHPGSVLREWLGEMQVSEAAAKLHVSRVTLVPDSERKDAGSRPTCRCASPMLLGPALRSGLTCKPSTNLWQASRKRRPKIELFKSAQPS